MTSISAVFSSTSYSPLQRLKQELQSEVSAGTVSLNDQTALSSALTDIDSSLKGDQNSGQSIAGHPASRGDIGSKINDLISEEVSNGKLTSGQATELQNLFARTFTGGKGSQSGEGAAGPASGPPPSDESSSSAGGFSIAYLLSSADNSSTAGSSSTAASLSSEGSSSTNATSDVSAILKDFLKLLQDSQKSATTYGTSGSTSASLSALLVNYQT